MLASSTTSADLVEAGLGRDAAPPSARERRAETVAGVGFVAVSVLLLAAFGDAGAWHPLPAASALLAMALAMHARFDFGSGYTPPTQLAFVPLLFTMPVAAVPIATAAALVLSRVPEVLRGEMRPTRLGYTVNNAWFAVGPTLVLLAAGGVSPSTALGTVALALIAQFAVDFAISVAREKSVRQTTIREELRLALPVYGVDAALAPVGLLAALAIERYEWAVLALIPLLGLLAKFARERRGRLEHMIELNNAYRGTALALGEVVEADDGYTGEHTRGVVALCSAVGRELGLDDRRLRNLEFAALLHDVGKVVIPKDIINKPGKLDALEWELIKTHTIEGQRMLDRIGGFMSEVGVIVRSHHERWDGTGYPDGLARDAIPVEARIITACDSWNAMRTNRPYRSAMSAESAREEITRGTGTQFDPVSAAALLAVTTSEHVTAQLPVAS